jgi:hypothetical protein
MMKKDKDSKGEIIRIAWLFADIQLKVKLKIYNSKDNNSCESGILDRYLSASQVFITFNFVLDCTW